MKKLLLLLGIFLSLGIQSVLAQTGAVLSGRLLDENGDGLPSASISVKGTQSGTLTDIDGNFQVQLPEGRNTLVIEALGYAKREVRVTDPTQPLNITMEVSAESIGIEIYGQTIDPKTHTGAVTTVTAEQIEKKTITNVVNALQGSNGINITSGGGQPGASPDIHVRGFGSLSANSAPLIVVDGMVYDGALSSINPNDVESISLLKDATASSLYGARGSNGVILITSKRGKKGEKAQISFEGQTGFVNRMLPAMNTIGAKDYYEMAFQMWKNNLVKRGTQDPNQPLNALNMGTYWDGILGGYNAYDMPREDVIDPLTGKINPNAKLMWDDNWMDELSRTGIRQEYNLSVANASDKSDYRFSVGYNKDQGIVKYTNFDRLTTKLNVNATVTDWLKSGVNFTGNYQDQRNFVSSTNAFSNPFMTAQTMGPIFPIYKHDTAGNIVLGPDGKPEFDFGYNPEFGQSRHFGQNTNVIASLSEDDRTSKMYSFRGVGYLEATFLKDFNLRSDISLDYLNRNQNFYGNMLYGDFSSIGGVVQKTLNTQYSYTWRQMLVWKPSFSIFSEGHNLAVTLNHENYLLSNSSFFLERTGFTGPEFKEGAAAAVAGSSTSSIAQLAMESYLGLASYDYKSKYFATASFRRDGTSRFSSNARWGSFWSAGAGWALTEEDFLKDRFDWLSFLKVRLSYGTQGNEDLGSFYVWLPRYFFNPNASNPGYSFNSWGNPNLKWEGKYMFNAGADLGFFNNRISASIEYYRSGTYDLLYVRPYAPSTGIGGIQDNVGRMENTGIEASIRANAVTTSDFNWNIVLNLQRNKNKIAEMQGGKEDSIVGSVTLMAEGLPVNSFFMPVYAGIDKTNGDELWRLADGTTTNDYTIASLNENRRYVGSPFRDLEGALENSLTYKGFEFYFQILFGIGGKFFDNNYYGLMQPDNAFQGRAWDPDILRSWSYDNQDGDLPRLGLSEQNIGSPSDRFLLNASFMKIQSVKFSYNLPQRWLRDAKIANAKVFIGADNVYLLAARKGVDIQQSYFGANSLSYFPYRSVMFGLNLGL